MVKADDAERIINNALKESVIRNDKSVRTAMEGIVAQLQAPYG